MDVTLVIAIIAAAATIVTACITLIVNALNGAKKKTLAEIEKIKVETEGETLDNLLKNKQIFDDLIKPLQFQIEELKKEIEQMKPFICKNALTCKNRLN